MYFIDKRKMMIKILQSINRTVMTSKPTIFINNKSAMSSLYLFYFILNYVLLRCTSNV